MGWSLYAFGQKSKQNFEKRLIALGAERGNLCTEVFQAEVLL